MEATGSQDNKVTTRSQAKAKESLKELKARLRKEPKMAVSKQPPKIKDVYEKVASSISMIRKETGIIYDEAMTAHKNEYDLNYPENPQRYNAVMQRCLEMGLLSRCERLRCKDVTLEQISKMHSNKMFHDLESICQKDDIDIFENEASKYDSVYFNKATLEAALKSAGCVTTLVNEVCKGTVQNGMAIVRPPGHHAMQSEFCGYCFFNNVAIAAQDALDQQLAKRILIVDFDVHHGQATQQMFYGDDRVVYFSMHRYQHGNFWPHLRESNFDYIGTGVGLGHNINVPLNEVGLSDEDYMSVVHHILLPIAYEYQPDLIIVSAGYDACIGCPEGEMEVTPGFYGHLIKLLSGLANGKIAVCLEGGYFLPSLAEGAAMTLKGLLDDPTAKLEDLTAPSLEITRTINNLKFMLRPYWNCFKILESHVNTEHDPEADIHCVHIKYFGNPLKPPFETRGFYPVRNADEVKKYTAIIDKLKIENNALQKLPVAYSIDEEMFLHESEQSQHPESSQRLHVLYEKFKEFELDKRCHLVTSQYANLNVLKLIHDKNYLEKLLSNKLSIPSNVSDVYYNEHTPKCVLKSAGCLLSVVDEVMEGKASCGAALIRPPGHHAERSKATGFCFVNNVSVAASHILQKYNVKKILILDFDVHHGNGTQHAFYNSNKVMYLSVHRYENGKFFPSKRDANYDKIGKGEGVGYNVNIPFNKDKMGNVEYITVFHRLILPIAYAFNPDVVLVSAGFDAGINDTLGHYKVTPEAFGHFVQMLKPLASGKIILALEGGYNVTTLSYSMVSCIKTLLGDPLPQLDKFETLKKSAHDTVKAVMQTQKTYWRTLNVDKKLPDRVSTFIHCIDDSDEIITIMEPFEDEVSGKLSDISISN